jgi:outer membrane protein OmpA-like peptidoglycan-associated protein
VAESPGAPQAQAAAATPATRTAALGSQAQGSDGLERTPDGWLRAILTGVSFEIGSDQLTAESRPAIERAAALISRYPGARVRIAGHTDSMGDEAVNRALSLRRAQRVRQILVTDYGVDPDLIEAEGYGEDQPIASNDTLEGRRTNRRVEVYILPQTQ